MIRLFEGVYTWGYWNQEKKYNFNGFLVTDGGKTIVIDPPALSEDDRAYLSVLGALEPEAALVSNRNHLRDHKSWGAPLWVHENEKDQIDVAPARLLKDGERVGPGLRVVHMPGKSPGEFSLYWPERRLLIIGDALIAPNGVLKTIPEAKLDDPKRLRESLRRYESLDFDAALFADGDPIMTGAKAAVMKFLASL